MVKNKCLSNGGSNVHVHVKNSVIMVAEPHNMGLYTFFCQLSAMLAGI